MAHENYRGQAAEQSTPYPPYDYTQTQYPDPRSSQNLAPPYPPEPASSGRPLSRRQTPSAYDNYQSAQSQPVHDAVANVFDASSGAAAQLPPDQVKQLKEDIMTEVLNSLNARGLLSPAAQQPQQSQQQQLPQQTNSTPAAPQTYTPQTYAPQPQTYHPKPQSPVDGGKPVPSRPVYTPPSPNGRSSHGSNLPDHQLPNENLHGSMNGAREDLAGRYGDRTEDLPLRRTETQSRRNHQDASTGDELSARRPPSVKRVLTDEEETVVEKMWQPLFADNKPTPRLGQFLRGLALHLVSYFSCAFILLC